MNRFFKSAGVLFGLIIAVVVAGVLYITTKVDPNEFKPLIVSQFKQFTGFEISIPGQLSWSFYPHLGMGVSEVKVSDPGVFTSQLKNLVVRVRFLPLLHKQFDFSKLSIEDLRLNELQATNVQAKLALTNQVLSIQSLTAQLYQGQLDSQATINLQQATPVMHITGNLNQVEVADLIKGLSGIVPKFELSGIANFSGDLTTKGKQKSELINQLNGQVGVAMSNGVVKGIDLAFYVNTAVALINKEPLPQKPENTQTEFGNLTGTAQVKDGIMTTNNLTLESPLFHASARGTIDLNNQSIDYHMDIISKIDPKANKLLALYGKAVPVRVTGSLSDPSIALDTLALMKEVGTEQLQRIGQEIQKAIPEKANNFIKSLFH